MRRSVHAILVLAMAAAVLPREASAITSIEGEYQLQLDVRRQDRFFPWDFESNSDDTWAASQMRLFTSPRTGVEAFVKFEADWNTGANNSERPVYQYRESHLRFAPLRDRDLELYIFSREDRFWVENHLLQVVQSGSTNDGGNGQGVRFNYRGDHGFEANYIVSDFSSQGRVGGGEVPATTDDSHIMRLRRDFGEAIRAGMTYTRKVEAQPNENGWNEVYAFDFRYTHRGTDLSIEYADSRTLGSNWKPEGSFNPDFDDGIPVLSQLATWLHDPTEFHKVMPSDAAFKAELRSIQIGNPKLGYYNIAPLYYYFGPDYAAFLGESTTDLVGWKVNTWYLVPGRAITVTADWEENRKSIFEQKVYKQFRAEVYTEYVNGFTSKIWYDRRKTTDFSNPLATIETKNYDLFGEVQVESRLAWMRVQGKIKDLETERKKELVSLESRVNITSTLKVYSRFAFGNDPARLRKGLFTEIQYRPRDKVDVFLSYGPWWIGDDATPVNDGDLEGGADHKDIVRLILKGNF